MMNNKISIILVTYNSLRHISDCLNSIFKNNDIGDKLDVIIVDNNSDDQRELNDLIKNKFSSTNVSVLETGDNCGYGKGNNYGIERTDSDIVIVMNPDVRLVCPIFKDVIEALNKPGVGMIGVDFVDGSPAYYFKKEYRSVFKMVFMRLYLWRRKYNAEKMFMSGSFFGFNKEAFNKAGMFDEQIFMYSEEADITNRMLKAGYKVEWHPEIKVLHLAHGRDYNENLHRIRLQSGRYYDKKYNLDSEKNFEVDKKALQIDIVISKLLGKKKRAEGMKKALNTLISFHDKTETK